MMIDILTLIAGKKKLTQSGWYSFNAICCGNRGHKPDTRLRGGIKKDGENWSYHCFNCGFKCGFMLGKSLTKNTKNLLSWCGVEEAQINKYSLESAQHKDLLNLVKIKKQKNKIKFNEFILDEGDLIDCNNKQHRKFIEYLTKRGINYNDYPFLVTPNLEGRQSNRIIIPFTYKNKIVGRTSRYLDDRKPKFINENQPGYVFGIDFQKPEYEVCILVEGIFDALSINGCALTHNTINENQSMLLEELNRPIIFVPDQDIAGLATIDKALELGYYVSIPKWDKNIKDVNDAVVKYGKVPTLLSILNNASNNKLKVELQRRRIERQL